MAAVAKLDEGRAVDVRGEDGTLRIGLGKYAFRVSAGVAQRMRGDLAWRRSGVYPAGENRQIGIFWSEESVVIKLSVSNWWWHHVEGETIIIRRNQRDACRCKGEKFRQDVVDVIINDI